LTELTGAETELQFERLAESRVRFITSRPRHLGNIHRAHAEFAPRPFHPQTAHITDRALAHLRREDAVEVRHREASYLRQHLPVQRLVDVLTDVQLHILDVF
jgi:hypothetical protein